MPLPSAVPAGTAAVPSSEPSFEESIEAAFSGGGTLSDSPKAAEAAPTETAKPAFPAPTETAKPAFPKIPSVAKPAVETSVVPAPEDEVPANLDAKAGAKWKEIRSESKAAKERADAAEARALAAEEKLKGYDPTEVETLRNRTKEYEGELSVVRVQATQEFKNAITAPRQAILDAAKTMAARYKVDEGDAIRAVSETDPDKQSTLLTNLATAFGERDRQRIYRLGDDMLSLAEREKLLVTNADAALKRINETRDAQLAQVGERSRAENTQGYDTLFSELKAQSPFFDADAADVDPAHKAALTEAATIARGVDFGTLPPKARAFAAYAGALLPYYMRVIGGQQAEMERLNGELATFRKASPSASGGSGPAVANGAVVDDSNTSFLDAIEAQIGK